jgi:hypothetical protein
MVKPVGKSLLESAFGAIDTAVATTERHVDGHAATGYSSRSTEAT